MATNTAHLSRSASTSSYSAIQGTTMTYTATISGTDYSVDLAWTIYYRPSGSGYEMYHKLFGKSTYTVYPLVVRDSSVANGGIKSWGSSTATTWLGVSAHLFSIGSSWTEILTSNTVTVSANSTSSTSYYQTDTSYVIHPESTSTSWSSLSQYWNVYAAGRLVTSTFILDKGFTWGGSTHYDYNYTQFTSTKSGASVKNPIYNTAYTCDSISPTSFTASGNEYISLNYNKDGCTTTGDQTSVALSKKVTYSSCKFVEDSSGTYTGSGISPGYSAPAITSDKTYHSSWREGTPVVGSSYITLPTVTASKRGYTFKNWVYNGSNIGSSGSESTKAFTQTDDGGTISANQSANRYTVTYDMNIGSETKGIVSPQMLNGFTKTFDTDATLSSTVPVWSQGAKTFLGWSTSSTATTATYSAGGTFTDPSIYDNNVSGIVLYAVWKNVNNTVNVNYSLSDGVHTEARTYNYTNLPWQLVNPQWEDHAFLGWTTTKPASWDTNHGIYVSSDDVESGITYDGNIWVKNSSQYLDASGKWGRTDTYYGLWVASKKYIKLDESWVAFDTIYVKDDIVDSRTGNKWHRVDDIYVKTSDGWKQLIEE